LLAETGCRESIRSGALGFRGAERRAQSAYSLLDSVELVRRSTDT
jgi:hypothetical protein